ncbi:MAG TPA: MMPL family transporter [Burkholderiales bacterium]|nr:MMPL family transporter [Burkholderiales bacterium]
MTRAGRWALGAWIAVLLGCAAQVARTEFSTDLSAFLPRSPSAEQQVLVEQLRDGAVSRLVLLGVERESPERLAQLSKALAASLRASGRFASVANGEEAGFEKDRELLWRYRYLLSPAVKRERFSAVGLREALEELLAQLASPGGVLMQRFATADPGGEIMRLAEQLQPLARPKLHAGVWFSADGSRALLLAQTLAAASDIDSQKAALELIHAAFAEAAAGSDARLLASGTGVFSVASRARIREDALRLSLLATGLISAMLLALYRSLRVLGLGLLPVASGALAGVAAVSLAFGAVHGITLAFGVTLIGEAVDYAIYLFTQNAPGAPPGSTFERLWPTLRLGMLTSIFGFSAMLFSDFTGLAQLGLFSIVGLLVAAAVTRWVLPELAPRGFAVAAASALAPRALALAQAAPILRNATLIVLAAAFGYLLLRPQPLWSGTLASLSPISAREQALDAELRRDLGAPDVRYLVVVHAPGEQAALRASEQAAAALRDCIARGWLLGFDSPDAYLPSEATQLARRAALPAPDALRANLAAARLGLPFKPDAFEPFVRDVSDARTLPLIDRAALRGTSLGVRLDSLLVKRASGWAAMLPLRGVSDAQAVAGALKGTPDAVLLDLKRQFDDLYAGYLREALINSLAGAAAIIVLLAAALRSPRRVFDVLTPLAAAALVTCALLALGGIELSIFHLVALVLVVAVGSNYSLFFDREAPPGEDRGRTVVSLGFAAATTVVGFGVLALSKIPVLNAIGSTVAMGAALALVFSATMARRT